MSTTTFELTDFTAPAYLHFNNEKFWEIRLKQESNETIVRCGKLTGKEEDSSTLQTLTKSHPNLGESITYMEKHVNLKLSKGYRFFKKEPEKPIMDFEPRVVQREISRTTAWSINIIPPTLERNNSDFEHKRRRDDDLERDDLKQTKYDSYGNNDYSNHATNHSNHANEYSNRGNGNEYSNRGNGNGNEYSNRGNGNGDDHSHRSNGFQGTGDADLDEAIALSIVEEARRKKLEKMRADKGDITMLSYNSSNNGNSHRDRDRDNSYDNGYSNSNSNGNHTSSFQGEYLTLENHRGVLFFKIQVLKKHLKIEKGPEGKAPEKEFKICHDNNDAITQARKQITELISKGYKTKSHKFTFDFSENELNFQRNSHHTVPRSAPASRGASPDDSRNLDAYNDASGVFDRLDVYDNDEDGYSNTSRRSAYWDLDEEQKESGRSTRGRSGSMSRGAVSDNDRDDDDENDEDFVGESADLGPDPLGKPISKNYTSVLLAHKWENEDPTGWYMSEKLDGVRCFWNGRSMWSRNNKQYFPPKWFVKDFPKSPLDGELWTGRSTFQKCVSVVRKQTPIDSEWRNVKYMVFDAPELKQPFKDRFKKMKEVFSKIKSPYIGLLEHKVCKGKSDLNEELAVVQNLGGEGMMIRNPNSHYECRRSRTLLKVKTFDDDEATIIGHEPGSGKYIGMCGALRVRNGAGIEFSVGSGLNDDMRARPPKIGVKITYKHQGVSNRGVPRFPTFLRLYQGN